MIGIFKEMKKTIYNPQTGAKQEKNWKGNEKKRVENTLKTKVKS